MRLGLIARADSRGLGVQTKAFHDHLHPDAVMVVDCPSLQPLRIRRDWYPDATWIAGIPTASDFETWLRGLDVVYTAETAYNNRFWAVADSLGVKTVLHGNYEFIENTDHPTVWAAPSLWNFDRWPSGAIHLPVPIETERFPAVEKPSTATRFLHVVGRPAIHDRNGTLDLLQALRYVTSRVEVTITCQHPDYVGKLIRNHDIHTGNVTLTITPGDVENYWDLYTGHHALILPRRFGGLCLPANEALGAGIPVIMPDIDPNNTWLPQDWLVPAKHAGEFRAKQRIAYYRTDPHALAAVIDRLATDEHFYGESLTAAEKLRAELSWDTMKPVYEDLFA